MKVPDDLGVIRGHDRHEQTLIDGKAAPKKFPIWKPQPYSASELISLPPVPMAVQRLVTLREPHF